MRVTINTMNYTATAKLFEGRLPSEGRAIVIEHIPMLKAKFTLGLIDTVNV